MVKFFYIRLVFYFFALALVPSCRTVQSVPSESMSKGNWQTADADFDLSDETLNGFRICGKTILKDCLMFEPTATSFSWNNALALSLLSHLVYDKKIVKPTLENSFATREDRTVEESREIAQKWGFDQYYFYNHEDNEYALLKHTNFIVVVFRGSSSFLDWIQNLDVANKNLENIKGYFDKLRSYVVHRGYSNAASAIIKKLRLAEAIEDMQPKDSEPLPVWFTGHSKGGAMAIITALELLRESKETIARVMTFGAPKVMGENLMEVYARFLPHSWRVIHHLDPVVGAPRSLGILRKKYVWEGSQIYLSREDCRIKKEWALKNRLLHVLGPGIWENGLQDHRLGRYIRCSHQQLHKQ